MRQKNGLTLIELQISALLMIFILVATGVIFYFALVSILYIQDAFSVYYNANTAMKLITQEVMRSNCYGSAQNRSGAIPAADTYHILDHGGVWSEMPTLGGNLGERSCTTTLGTGLYLRQATQAASITGTVSDVAGDFSAHEIACIFLDDVNRELRIARNVGIYAPVQGDGFLVATDLTEFVFVPVSYNCVAVRIIAEGRANPWTGDINNIRLSKLITLRCAPGEPLAPWNQSW